MFGFGMEKWYRYGRYQEVVIIFVDSELLREREGVQMILEFKVFRIIKLFL